MTDTASPTMMASNNSAPDNETLWKKIQRKSANGWASTRTKSINVKETAIIKKLELDILLRKRQFGVEYLTLKESEGSSPDEIQGVLDVALEEIASLKEQIHEHKKTIDLNRISLQQKIEENANPFDSTVPSAAIPSAVPAPPPRPPSPPRRPE
jgi:hypothetical protein